MGAMHAAAIPSIPLFSPIPRRRRRDVARLADEVTVPAGYGLTAQGGYAREFFVVVSGTADVLRGNRLVGVLGPGDFFGEIGLFSRRWLRTATVVATSPMRLLVLGRHEFRELLAAFPAVAAPIRKAASARA
jgi:cAMP-dependent protein kinase regulator/CRP/FNR family cyclic AMP-dependent transcriptional regulator/cGMP-dependent protein kinase 2